MASKQMQGPLYLFANGSGNSAVQRWPGGEGMFSSEHTGGTVSLEFSGANPDTDLWFAVGANTTLAASGAGLFSLPPGTRIRANGGAATAIYAYVHQTGTYI